MDGPTCENKRINKIDLCRPDYIEFSSAVDDRGRISIPSEIRKLTDRYIVFAYYFLDEIIYTQSIPIDKKNRISIPSFVRRTLAINNYDKLSLFFASNKIFIIKNEVIL